MTDAGSCSFLASHFPLQGERVRPSLSPNWNGPRWLAELISLLQSAQRSPDIRCDIGQSAAHQKPAIISAGIDSSDATLQSATSDYKQYRLAQTLRHEPNPNQGDDKDADSSYPCHGPTEWSLSLRSSARPRVNASPKFRYQQQTRADSFRSCSQTFT
jgi:hypothetical protein